MQNITGTKPERINKIVEVFFPDDPDDKHHAITKKTLRTLISMAFESGQEYEALATLVALNSDVNIEDEEMNPDDVYSFKDLKELRSRVLDEMNGK